MYQAGGYIFLEGFYTSLHFVMFRAQFLIISIEIKRYRTRFRLFLVV